MKNIKSKSVQKFQNTNFTFTGNQNSLFETQSNLYILKNLEPSKKRNNKRRTLAATSQSLYRKGLKFQQKVYHMNEDEYSDMYKTMNFSKISYSSGVRVRKYFRRVSVATDQIRDLTKGVLKNKYQKE